ncbi:mechanosensitive ion channel protein 6-like [Canna indica]|uniref:Mechanosensitive ion channel protein 6-like n=1 Tax=Canna indica TaxID=4628 RepID=A0AAQ3KGS7_9LILI|nr:mechanosensitive ion channel protein 6-like [Canna indica]
MALGDSGSTSSSSSFRRTSSLLRTKTRSRLMDDVLPPVKELAARQDAADEDDDDPFDDDDDEVTSRVGVDDTKGRLLKVLQWASLVVLLAAFATVLAVPALRCKELLGLGLWGWDVMVFVIICGHLMSGWAIHIAVFFMERNFLFRKRVLYFVYGVRKPVQNCFWLGVVLIAWHLLIIKKVEHAAKTKVLKYVSEVLLCLLITTLCRLVKTIIIKSLASSYHVSTYFDRIQEALFNQYIIETLSCPCLSSIKIEQPTEEVVGTSTLQSTSAATVPAADLNGSPPPPSSDQKDKTSMRNKKEITIEQLQRMNQNNVSACKMKRMMKIVSHGTLTLSMLHQKFVRAEEDESETQIRNEREAKAAAKTIFDNVAKHGENCIYLEDLMRFTKEDVALKTMALFEGAEESNKVCKKTLKNWVVNVFRERKALSLTLNDTKTAINKLNQIANIIIGAFVLVVSLLILDIATYTFFVFLGSQLLLVTFVFGNTLKMIFEAIIFLFVMHPFDVGDHCEIEGVQMVVEEMNILTTVFLKFDNQKIYYPNNVLATLPIHNLCKSPDMGDAVDFCVDVSPRHTSCSHVNKLAMME